jgi:5,10-methylenetetrahydromethanopterin reductase
MVTEKVRLGMVVSNVVTRHVSVLASLANTIGELSDGRFVLGVGVGDTSVRTIGLAPATGRTMRARIGEFRELLTGHDNAEGFHLREPLGACPVLVAATGPRNLELAGEIGDGVILLGGGDAAGLRARLGRVHAGAVIAGRNVDEVEVAVATYGLVSDDLERDARELKPMVATIAQQGGAGALQRLGIDVEPPPAPVPIYPDLVHAEDWAAAVRTCSGWISDDDAVRFAEGACVAGDEGRVREILRSYAAAGVSEIILHHVGPYSLPVDFIESLGPLLTRDGQREPGV